MVVIYCIISFVVGAMLMLCAIGLMSYQKDKKQQNKVHFYVTRQDDGNLHLWFGKPIRYKANWTSGWKGFYISEENRFYYYKLNVSDYNNLKYEDDPVEVFLNLED